MPNASPAALRVERLDPGLVPVYRTMTSAQRVAVGLSTMSYGEPRATERSQLERRLRRALLPGSDAWCSPPEELVVKKLLYYQQGASDKHLRDIASMLRISPEQTRSTPRLKPETSASRTQRSTGLSHAPH